MAKPTRVKKVAVTLNIGPHVLTKIGPTPSDFRKNSVAVEIALSRSTSSVKRRSPALPEGTHTMGKLIFVNLPVTDLQRSISFYEAVGASNNPRFTDDTAACMVFSEAIHAMLLTHDKWRQFTAKPIVDAHASAQVLLCLSEDSRDAVSATVEKAASAGGKADPTPIQDLGFMYGRSFEDPDGHIWEVMWMDPNAAPPHAA
jgi:predicted lactoylglutathione lyase